MLEQTIRAEICRFIVENPANRLPDGSAPYFDEPLVGLAALDDPLFDGYKSIIGEFHLTPRELMAANGVETSGGTVICWVLPVAEQVRKSNRPQLEWPSLEWSQTRTFGEALNGALRRHLVEFLEANGQRALAPQFAAQWQELAETPVGRASTWSERHAAYAAGLGTFSLNDAMITPKGIAHRLGSVITGLVLPPSPRPYPDYRNNCLYYREGGCGACIGRCPVGALSWQGHDKARCKEYVYETVPAAVGESYGVSHTGCGLCQTRVPCESAIPPSRKRPQQPA